MHSVRTLNKQSSLQAIENMQFNQVLDKKIKILILICEFINNNFRLSCQKQRNIKDQNIITENLILNFISRKKVSFRRIKNLTKGHTAIVNMKINDIDKRKPVNEELNLKDQISLLFQVKMISKFLKLLNRKWNCYQILSTAFHFI
ncbi:unnamed protein product [Paramecium sonneborni]|uniref:Uncharacterized protein n=1 Tax=Paramecium sonneborni TaxID=65129 RepID=A0A8S1LAI3_9CILI|nr:unnamed protein product [Paramecium sonneborni]